MENGQQSQCVCNVQISKCSIKFSSLYAFLLCANINSNIFTTLYFFLCHIITINAGIFHIWHSNNHFKEGCVFATLRRFHPNALDLFINVAAGNGLYQFLPFHATAHHFFLCHVIASNLSLRCVYNINELRIPIDILRRILLFLWRPFREKEKTQNEDLK